MDKREFNEIISSFEPDGAMKERIERRVLNMENISIKPKKSLKKTVIISVCAAAAAIAISVPVMAEHIPAVRSAIEFLMGSYSKEPIKHNDAVPELADSVNAAAEDTEKGVVFNVQDVYFDGNDIAVYYMFEADDPVFSEYMGVSTKDFELYADGKRLVWSEEKFYESVRIISAGKCGDRSFAGMINFKADVLPENDNFDMEIKLNSLCGSKNIMVFNYDAENPAYEWQTPDKMSVNISCKFNVGRKDGLVKTYEIGEEKAGYILNSVTVTPLKTIIDLSGPSDSDVSWTLTDSSGNEIEYMGSGEFDSPLKNTERLTLTLKDLYKDGLPEICSFTFDIDGGYRNADIDSGYVRNEPEYIPSEEEADKWVEENRIRLTAANADINPAGSYIDVNGGQFSVTVSDYTLIKNVNDLDLTGDVYSPYENYSRKIDENGNIVGMTLVVFDYTVRNNRGEELQLCTGYEKLVSSDDMTITLNSGEPAYLSPKDNGGKNAYMLNLAPYEERTVKIGFMIQDKYSGKELIFSMGGMNGDDISYLAFNS